MDYKIRDVSLSDYNFLCKAFAQVNDLHCDLRPDYYRRVEPVISKKNFALAIVAQNFEAGQKKVSLKIAEQDNQRIGAVFSLSVQRRALGWSKFPKEACVDNIIVLPDYRKHGVGEALLNESRLWAQRTGHEYMFAKIAHGNRVSQNFFVSNGFETTDIFVGMALKQTDMCLGMVLENNA